jgi:hypothetical protein
MSRHPIPLQAGEPTELEEVAECFIAFVSQHALPKSIDHATLVTATHSDEALCKLKDKLGGVELTKEGLGLVDRYMKVFDELSVSEDGKVLRGRRIVIPDSLIDRVLSIAHEGHLGVVKTKSLMRTKVWFPGLDFNGNKFKEFSEYLGLRHRKITPLLPQANGQCESFMKNLGKVIRGAITERREWKGELNKFLRNYRSVPHSTTGIAPSVLMFNRNKTSRLPDVGNAGAEFELKDAKQRDEQLKWKSKVYTDY